MIATGGLLKLRLLVTLLLLTAIPSAPHLIATAAGGAPACQKQPPIDPNPPLGRVRGVAFSGANLYFVDSIQHVAYSEDSSGKLTVIAGRRGSAGDSGDGGPATNALLNTPTSVAVSGDVYIADSCNKRIRRILANNGNIVTYAGNGTDGYSGDDVPATSAGLVYPTALAFDGAGNLYFADGGTRIRMIVAPSDKDLGR